MALTLPHTREYDIPLDGKMAESQEYQHLLILTTCPDWRGDQPPVRWALLVGVAHVEVSYPAPWSRTTTGTGVEGVSPAFRAGSTVS